MARTSIAEKLLLDALFQMGEIYRTRFHSVPLKQIIILLRQRLKMSQKTLAKRANIPPSTLSRIESGKGEPSLRILGKIFQALFCDFVLLPIPRRDLDLVVKQQIHHLAKKRIQYLKGTMALELQQPNDAVIREMMIKEERDLLSKNFDIWKEGTSHDDQ